MKTWRVFATALVAVGILTSVGATGGRTEERKDWFGRPLQACEPKCHWQWWLGRKAAPAPTAPSEVMRRPIRTAARPSQDNRIEAARHRRSMRPAARATRIASPLKRRTAQGAQASRTGVPEAWPAEPADLIAVAMMGPAAPERMSGEPAHGGRVASSFGAMALLVVRRSAVFEAPSGGLVASDAQAATLGDIGPQLVEISMPLSDAVLDRAEGLEQVAAGALRGFVVSRLGSRQALAEHPDLMALPLTRAETEPPLMTVQDMASRASGQTAFDDPPAPDDGTATAPPDPTAESNGPVAHAFAATASVDGAPVAP